MNKNNPHSLKQEFTEYARTCILSRRPSDKEDFVIGRSAADSYVSFVEVDKLLVIILRNGKISIVFSILIVLKK